MAQTLVVTSTADFRNVPFRVAISDLIISGGGVEATFDASQFGSTGLSNTLRIFSQSGSGQEINVFMASSGSFSAAGWDVSGWQSSAGLLNFTGSSGNDSITGTSTDDHITGGNGRDTLRGGAGDDTFTIDGNDFGAGEFIDGGTNTTAGDTLRLIGGGATYDLTVGTVRSIETVEFRGVGTAVFTAAQIATISTIRETFDNGNQSLVVRGSSVDLSHLNFVGWDDADRITINGTGTTPNTLKGTFNRDTIIGASDAANTITGGFGGDTLIGGSARDTFVYKDVSDAEFGRESVEGGGDIDTLLIDQQFGGDVRFRLSELDISSVEVLRFNSINATAVMSGDHFAGAGGGSINTVIGNSGVNRVEVQGPIVDLSTVTFVDWSTDDRIFLQGTDAGDTLIGTANRDSLAGGAGRDTMVGGLGDDKFLYFAATDVQAGEFVNGSEGIDTLTGVHAGTLRLDLLVLQSIEVLEYLTANSTMQVSGSQIGGGALSTVRGNSAGNHLIVTGAADLSGLTFEIWDNVINTVTIQGTAGSDTLVGSSQDDDFFGFAGNDVFVVNSPSDTVTEAVGGGNDRVRAIGTYALTDGSEIETLEAFDLAGTANFDLVGNGFGNTIRGNNGQNTLVGGLGLDTLIGNGGGDVFAWRSTAETGATTGTADVVGGDFNPLVGDLLAFNLIDANETLAGDQAFTFIGAGSFTAAGQIRSFNNGVDTFIELNTDGDITAEAMVRVQGVHAVDASWFVF